MQRGRVYYAVRTLVRWVFWSTILFLIVVGLGTVLEFFDKTKFTRRVGDAHVVIRAAAEAFGDGDRGAGDNADARGAA